MRDIDPLDLGLEQKRVGQPSETNADNSIVSLGVHRDEDARELSCHCSRHVFPRSEAVVNDMDPGGDFGGDAARHGHATVKNLRGRGGVLY